MDDVRRAEESMSGSSAHRSGYAEWIALGALVAGSVGAIVGARRSSHRGNNHHAGASSPMRPDPTTLTAPHGDKLSPLV